GPAAHEYVDMLHTLLLPLLSSASPSRTISQRSKMSCLTNTRRRTSSPSASRSAARAPPVLIRKLQCFSDISAAPRRRPRPPTESISSHALRPFGLAKVEPPVRLRTG